MAEGLLRHLLPAPLCNTVHVKSAGTHAIHGNHAEPFAIKAAAEFGADISGHRAKLLGPHLVNKADLIITMEKMHVIRVKQLLAAKKQKPFILGAFDPDKKNPEIDDPYGGSFDQYRVCVQTIVKCLDGVMDLIKKQP